MIAVWTPATSLCRMISLGGVRERSGLQSKLMLMLMLMLMLVFVLMFMLMLRFPLLLPCCVSARRPATSAPRARSEWYLSDGKWHFRKMTVTQTFSFSRLSCNFCCTNAEDVLTRLCQDCQVNLYIGM